MGPYACMRGEEVPVGVGGPPSWMLTWVAGQCLREGIQHVLLAQPVPSESPKGTRL